MRDDVREAMTYPHGRDAPEMCPHCTGNNGAHVIVDTLWVCGSCDEECTPEDGPHVCPVPVSRLKQQLATVTAERDALRAASVIQEKRLADAREQDESRVRDYDALYLRLLEVCRRVNAKETTVYLDADSGVAKLTAERDALAYHLKIYIHAHETGNSVPPHLDAQARAALKETK